MNAQQLKRELQQQEINRIVRRRTRNLAESLAYLAEVSEGRQLVALIGNGDEFSNIEALQTWVAFELKNCNLSEESELDYLYARLFMVLGDYTPSML
jgi:hypothetical protein